MSYYFKYNFTSPEIIYSVVKEELKSYFDTGAVDDLMFATYVDRCLSKLGRSSYVIHEKVLDIEDFEARLPDNFYAVREAWLCTELRSDVQAANAFYSQTDDPTTILISALTTDEVPCANPACTNSNCDGSCVPSLIRSVYRTTTPNITQIYRKEYLLKPGNISARKNCDVAYTNEWNFYTGNTHSALNTEITHGDSAYDSFDIRDNKFVTNFRNAVVQLVFYATEYDGTGNQLVPDNFRIRDYVEKFIKYKVFETLTNQVNDETFQQLQQKMIYYKQLADEAYIIAEVEIKKQTIYQKQHNLKRGLNRLNMYELPNRTNRSGLRRNN